MNTSQNGNEKKKKKFITPSKTAFVFAMAAILCVLSLLTSAYRIRGGIGIISSGAVFILGAVSLSGKSKQKYTIDKIFAIVAVVLSVIMFVLMIPPRIPIGRVPASQVICVSNLRSLGISMQFYAQEYKDKYPAPGNWCDLLIKLGVKEKSFKCESAKKSGNTNRSHYAMNPNCEPNSPPTVVLLFETKGGWNQSGEAELLTTENHKGKGCFILFNNKDINFVSEEDFSKLKWK